MHAQFQCYQWCSRFLKYIQQNIGLLTLFSLMPGLLTGCLGGGSNWPLPSIFLLWYKSIIFDKFWKALALNLQKNGKFAKIQLFVAKSSYKAKDCANCMTLYVFEKPFTQQIQMCKIICKIFKTWICVFKKNWICANSL